MRRFFVEEINSKGGALTITGPEAKHITKVLRMGPGDRFILMDSSGSRYQALIVSAASAHVSVLIEKHLPKPPPSPVEITLCQALLKSRPMDYLIQKTSELGINFIIPFSSERTVVKIQKNRYSNKIKHWMEIARNSAKQSDRDSPAKIYAPYTFKELIAECKGQDALKVVLWEEEQAEDLKGLLRTFSQVKKYIGIVGPEGGFGSEEIAATREAGFIPVSLGNRILRAETAAIVMVAIVQYEWGDLSFR